LTPSKAFIFDPPLIRKLLTGVRAIQT